MDASSFISLMRKPEVWHSPKVCDATQQIAVLHYSQAKYSVGEDTLKLDTQQSFCDRVIAKNKNLLQRD